MSHRGASWTWFDLHAELVEGVFLAGDIHVLAEQRPSGGSFQAGVGRPWAKETRGPKKRWSAPKPGVLTGGCVAPWWPQEERRQTPELNASASGDHGTGPHLQLPAALGHRGLVSSAAESVCPLTGIFPHQRIFSFRDSNLIFSVNRVFSPDCSHQIRETITQNFSKGVCASF